MLPAILKLMKQGGYPKGTVGFTIVETLIVLAVSSLLLVSAIVLISGRTDKTQFMTAANDLKQSLEQVINETASGYFPNANNFYCVAVAGGMPTLANGTRNQGTNGGCMFLGKAVQFGAKDYDTGFITYAIASNRLTSSGEVTSLSQAFPEAVAPGTGANNPSLTDLITTKTPLQNGLTAAKMTYSGGNTSGFAFLSTFGSYSGCIGICTGASAFTLYAIDGTQINGNTGPEFVDVLDGGDIKYKPTTSITACFNSGTTDQSVVYTIGSSGNSKAVTMQIQSGAC